MRWSPLWKLLLLALLMGAALMQAAAAEYRIIDSSTDERCTAHECQRIISSYARFTEDKRNASDALGISYTTGLLNYSCTDYWAAFEVRVHTALGDYPLRTMLNAYPSIRDSIVKEQQSYGWKYGLRLESLPPAAQAALLALELRLAKSGGITYAEISREGYDLIGRGCRFIFADLVESGFSVEMNRTSIIIGNVSGKAELLLDPTVTLNSEQSIIVGDTYISNAGGSNPQGDLNYGNAHILISVQNGTGGGSGRKSYMLLNWSTLNLTNASNVMLNIYDREQSVSTNFSGHHQVYPCNNSIFAENVLTWNNEGSYITDCSDALAASTPDVSGAGFYQFNITPLFNGQTDESTTLRITHNGTCDEGTCQIWYSSKEDSTASRRPFLNITYYRNVKPNATATLLPAAPTERDGLACNHTYVDADGDAENGTEFMWFKDGGGIGGQTQNTLSPSFFSWGNLMVCSVRPRDGRLFGEWSNSSAVFVRAFGGGAGGGGGTLVVVSPESQIGIDFGRAQYSLTVLTAPSSSTKTFPVTNRGQRNLKGSVRMLGNLSEFVTVEICSLEATGCSANQVSIAAGETVLLRLAGSFPRGWGPQTEGLVRLRDGFTGEASDLVVTADRPPLAFFNIAGLELGYVGFSQRFDLSERAALFAYLAMLGLALLAFGGAAA